MKYRKPPGPGASEIHGSNALARLVLTRLARDYTPPDIETYAATHLQRALTLLEKLSLKQRMRDLILTVEMMRRQTWFENPVVRAGEQIELYELLHAPRKRGRPLTRARTTDPAAPSPLQWSGLPGLDFAVLQRALLGKAQKRNKAGRPKERDDDELVGYADIIDDIKQMRAGDLNRRVSDREAVDYVREVLGRIGGAVNSKRSIRNKVSYLLNLLKTARKRRKEIAVRNST